MCVRYSSVAALEQRTQPALPLLASTGRCRLAALVHPGQAEVRQSRTPWRRQRVREAEQPIGVADTAGV